MSNGRMAAILAMYTLAASPPVPVPSVDRISPVRHKHAGCPMKKKKRKLNKLARIARRKNRR